ncbi:MAG: galactose-1-phosphate uridylyltransferase [Omnitrophica WOR_2 bacterium SM23_29]|nr:MAG: galactose-1-phosphate uridylyltransferase [Omnitrophica WOR_2 bacterium SM23_29]
MPELRKDPIIGRWVIIATERARRPSDFVPHAVSEEKYEEPHCPFCVGRESETSPEIFAIREPNTKPNSPGWHVRVVPSISPILKIEGELERRGKGIYDVLDGIGAHEVVLETPEHIHNIADLSEKQITDVISTYIDRIVDLSKDPRFKYVLLFKNYGIAAGASKIRHARSQLIALPVNPIRLKDELVGARQYFEYKERCIYCDIIRQELEAGKRIVADINGFLAIAPFSSRFPFEMWLLPREHSADFFRLEKAKRGDLAKILKLVLNKLRRALADPAYNIILHTAPFRTPKAGYWRTIDEDFHWHMEIMPRLTRVAGFEWGSGFYINPTPPEDAARYLKEVEL